MKVVGVIEARMGSSRLPEKTLKEVYNGMSLLECVVKRFRMCKRVNEVVVATTHNSRDDQIIDWCTENNVSYFRGSEEDVLDRVAKALINYNADIYVKSGGDTAYLDFELTDRILEMFINGSYDFISNDLKLTFPLGIYTHICYAKTIIELNKNKELNNKDRDDVTRFIYEHPKIYKIKGVEAPAKLNYPNIRLTVDYPEDLQLARDIYSFFSGYKFTTEDIIDLYNKTPKIFERTKELIQHSAPFLKERK